MTASCLLPVQALTPTKVAVLTSAQMAVIDIGAFTSAKVAPLSAKPVEALTTAQMAALTYDNIASLSTATMAALGSAQVAALTTAAESRFGTAQIGAITTAAISGLTAAEAAARVGSFKPGQITAFGNALISALTTTQVKTLSTAQVAALTSTNVVGLSTAAVTPLTSAQVAARSSAQAKAHTNVSKSVILISGATASAVEGVLAPASFTATVYIDANADGRQDNGELGLAGVRVALLNGSGAPTVRTAVTKANGAATFAGLARGSYEVSIAPAAGNAITQHSNVSKPVALTAGTTASAVEGVCAAASFTATVYTDADGDGIQDNAEVGLAGVRVNLLDGSGTPTGRIAITDASGVVTFSGLAAGTYEVSVVAPAGDTVTQDSNVMTPVTLVPGGSATATLGVTPPQQTNFTTIVYTDTNADGVQDYGETGLAGIIVRLLNGSGASIGLAAVTDASGAATFTNLAPGSYEAEVLTPAGFSVTQEINIQTPATLGAGSWASAIEGLNAQGIVVQAPASFTTTVYADTNGNGIQDSGEAGLAGVTVNLLNASGAPTGHTAVTDGSGVATFTGLAPGSYQMSADTPANDVVTQHVNLQTPVTLAPGTTANAVVGVQYQAGPATQTPPQAGANASVGLVAVGAPVYAAGSTVLTVGVGREFSTIAAAVNASQNGDVILVDSGTYTNDFVVANTDITLIAVGGRVTMNATVPPPDLKGIITEEADLTVEGFDFTNCAIPDADGHNGAGIRVDNGNLTLSNDSFTANQDGILTNAGAGISVTIDHCVFNDNGCSDPTDSGNTHNVYIGDVASATVTNSIFENAQVGHEFKSRAEVNTLTNNEFINGVGIGTGSYDIDLPNGGTDVLTSNTIVKGPNAENDAMVHFGGEGIPYAGSSLIIQNNLFNATTNPNAIGLLNQTPITVDITQNVLDGLSAAALASGPATERNNYDFSGTMLPNTSLEGVLPGSTLIISDAAAHDVTLNGRVQAVEGGAGLLTLDVEAGHIIAIGGSGGLDVTENATTGGNQYTTAAGSKNTLLLNGVGLNSIDSEGTDYIYGGNGNESGQLNGTATVVQGSGTNSWSVNGTASIDTNGLGGTFIALGATADLALTGTNTFFSLTTNGGAATWNTMNAGSSVDGSVIGGAIQMQVYEREARITTAGGLNGSVIRLDTGAANVISQGADKIYAGAGAVSVIVSGTAKIYAGSGTLSVYGRSDVGGADVYGTNGNYLIDGDTGNITYHGGDQASTVQANLSSITLIGGAGLLTINGGSRDTLIGGSGGIIYNDFGCGANTVTTMAGSTNLLDISASDQINSYGNDSIDHNGGNTSIALYGNASLTLEGGNSQIFLAGHDTVREMAGNDGFTVSSGADVSIATVDRSSINETGATVRVSFSDPTLSGAAPTAVTVTGGVAQVNTSQGSAVAVATGGTAAANIVASTGSTQIDSYGADTIHLGSGTGTVTIHGSGAELWAGSGSLTLHGYDWSGGNFILTAGSGAIVVDQASSAMKFIGGSGTGSLTGGQMDIIGGSGALTVSGAQVTSFQGGSGSANLSLNESGSNIGFGTGSTTVQERGWGASDVFTFLAGQSGTDVISGFRTGVDKAILGAGVSIASQAVVSNSAQFLLSNGAHVTFNGISSTHGLF